MFCWKCGEDNNDRYIFCVSCGSSLRTPLPGGALPTPDTIANLIDEAAVTIPNFVSNISYPESKRKSGKFILIAGAGLAFLIFTAIIATLVWRQLPAGGEEQKGITETGNKTVGNSVISEDNSSSNDVARKPSKADEEFARINAELNSADLRKTKAVIENELKSAESRFPDDYRFAYQAAKLEAMTSKSHHEAFEMLFSVGKKAIEAGKSADLLLDLQKDGSSSLKRLTDHKEWAVLNNALRRNNSKALEESGH